MRTYGQYCAVAKALDVVGNRWALLIVRELLLRGQCRYVDLQDGLPGIATNLLADRLRELEQAGIVRREEAPPPVARTLFHLTADGHELGPIIRALGHWGARYMSEPSDSDRFRSHWLAFPISEFLELADPSAPPTRIELRTGEQPVTIETSDGAVCARLGPTEAPDLVLSGPPHLILGVLSGRLAVADACQRGLDLEGDSEALARLRPKIAAAPLPA